MASRRARDIRPRKQHFLWGGRIPENHLTVIGGAPSLGKSTLGYLIFAQVGLPAIFATTEENDETVWRPRLEAVGGDLDQAFHHPEIMLSRDPQDLQHLAELIELYGAKLLFVDPATNHLRDCTIYKDDQVRRTLVPYLDLMQELDFTIVFQVHVLRGVPKNAHPRLAFPGGVESLAKALYLFGKDPRLSADPALRVLACAEKFNFGPEPPSILYEHHTEHVRVWDHKTRKWGRAEYGVLRDRGQVGVTARSIVVTLRPEDRERKSDRVAMLLLDFLRHGPKLVTEVRKMIDEADPPVSWRTAARVGQEMKIEQTTDPSDKRFKLWSLPQELLDTLAEAEEGGIDLEMWEIEEGGGAA